MVGADRVRGVGNGHGVTVGGLDGGELLAVVEVAAHDLGGVGVVASDDDEGVGVLVLVGERDRDGLVELLEVADGAADVGGVLLLVDHRALGLEEEPVGVVEELDGLLGHRGQVGLAGAVCRLACGLGAAGTGRGRDQRLVHRGHVAAGEEAEDGAGGEGRHVVEPGGVLDEAVLVGVLSVGEHAGAGVGGLGVARCAAAHEDVDLVVDELLGDGTTAAVDLAGRGAVGHVGRALAGPGVDVGASGGRGGVGDLGGRDVADELALLLVLLQNGLVVLTGHVGCGAGALGDAPVDGLLAGRPAARGGGGVRHVRDRVVRPGADLEAVGRHRAGERQRVEGGEAAAGAVLVVAGRGDHRVVHAVADDEDDVARLGGVDLLGELGRAVLGEADGRRSRDRCCRGDAADGHEAGEGRGGRDDALLAVHEGFLPKSR